MSMKWLYGACAGAALLGAAAEAQAANATLEVEYVSTLTGFDNYVYVEGALKGEVAREAGTANYVAPVIFIYPKSGASEFGIVDWAVGGNFFLFQDANSKPVVCDRDNNSAFCEEGETAGHLNQKQIFQYTRLLTEDYLFESNDTFLSVQWDKLVTDSMGPDIPDGTQRRRLSYGTIEESADRYEILLDAAAFMRAPNLSGLEVPAPAAATTLIASGYSQTAFMSRAWLAGGHNVNEDESLVYDGFVTYGSGSFCFNDVAEAPFSSLDPCPGPPALNAEGANVEKYIAVQSESDILGLIGFFSRDDGSLDDFYRQYELAGISHLPSSVQDATHMGAMRQNPVAPFAAYRGAMANMKAWLADGTAPPASLILDGVVDAETFSFTPVPDDDGNLLGGLRLPHMPTTLEDDSVVGAPTGVYSGLDLNFAEDPNLLLLLGGAYDRFDAAELESRYPDTATYDALVTAAADALLEGGYILQADRDVFAAGVGVVPTPPDIPETPDAGEEEKPRKDSCSAAGGGTTTLIGWGLVLLALAAIRRRKQSATNLFAVALVATVGVGTSACGDDDGGSSGADAGECRGHFCEDPPIKLPEGGEIRLELVELTDGPIETRAQGWFASAQMPPFREFSRDPAEWKIQDGDSLCKDMRSDVIFPSGEPMSRTYRSVGDTLSFNRAGESTSALTLTQQANKQGFANDNFHDIVYLGDLDVSEIEPGTTYDVVTDDITYEQSIVVPENYVLEYPSNESKVIIPPNTDLPFIWNTSSDDPYDFAFVSFADQFGPLYFCIGPQSGQMTIPQSVIDALPSGGQVLHGVLNHQALAEDVGGSDRRIDFIGINCKANTYVKGVSPLQ